MGIVVSVKCDYLASIAFGQSVRVGLTLSVLGTKEPAFSLPGGRRTGRTPFARGEVVMVSYDHLKVIHDRFPRNGVRLALLNIERTFGMNPSTRPGLRVPGRFLVRLLNTLNPTGFMRGRRLTRQTLLEFPQLSLRMTKKGALLAIFPGEDAQAEPARALTGHVDTLGGMVRVIKPSGRLELTNIGGFAWNAVEGEGVSVHTQSGALVRGSLLPNHASVHVYGDVKDQSAGPTWKCAWTRAPKALRNPCAGIQVGDFVSFDPRVELTNGCALAPPG